MRWANIQAKGCVKIDPRSGRPFVRPMRIEAVAGDHFVFQAEAGNGFVYDHKVVVLHRDAFDVAPWPETGFLANGYEKAFEYRFRTTAHDEESEESEDDE